ncbi:hypothetical protein ACRYI5_10740 [Furfurilactobacillus sp. WILCCON 0119]
MTQDNELHVQLTGTLTGISLHGRDGLILTIIDHHDQTSRLIVAQTELTKNLSLGQHYQFELGLKVADEAVLDLNGIAQAPATDQPTDDPLAAPEEVSPVSTEGAVIDPKLAFPDDATFSPLEPLEPAPEYAQVPNAQSEVVEATPAKPTVTDEDLQPKAEAPAEPQDLGSQAAATFSDDDLDI